MSKFFSRKLMLLPLAVLVLDRILKLLAQNRMSAEPIGFIQNIVSFKFFGNPGIVLSLPFSGPLVWIASILVMLIFTALAWEGLKKRHFYTVFFYSFFILGASSNFFDRIVYGHTVDYFIFFERSAVNIADGMILIGAILLIRRT